MREAEIIFHVRTDPLNVGGRVSSNEQALTLIVRLEALRLCVSDTIDVGNMTLMYQSAGNWSSYSIEGNKIQLYFCDRTIRHCLSFLIKYYYRGAADVSHLDEEFDHRHGGSKLDFTLSFDRFLPAISNQEMDTILKGYSDRD